MSFVAACAACADAPVARIATSEATVFDVTHARWSALLAKHVHGDRVDYAGLRAERDALASYLGELASLGPDELAALSEADRFAYWINVYNAFCLALVVDEAPKSSIKDLGGALVGRVWDRRFIPLDALNPAGKARPLSLNDVEHEILRARFPDARVHAAINCASESCPPLRPEAFVGARLEEQLDEQMRAFVADPTRNRFDAERGILELSSIFKWFREDFERDAGGVKEYVARYAPEPMPWANDATVRYLDYSWALNAVPESAEESR